MTQENSGNTTASEKTDNALFSKQMLMTSAASSAVFYGFFLSVNHYSIHSAQDSVTEKLATLKTESAEVAQNPSSAKAINYLGSPRNFVTEISVQEKKLTDLKETNPVSELGGIGPIYAVAMGLAVSAAWSLIKNGITERKEEKRLQKEQKRKSLLMKVFDDNFDARTNVPPPKSTNNFTM